MGGNLSSISACFISACLIPRDMLVEMLCSIAFLCGVICAAVEYWFMSLYCFGIGVVCCIVFVFDLLAMLLFVIDLSFLIVLSTVCVLACGFGLVAEVFGESSSNTRV